MTPPETLDDQSMSAARRPGRVNDPRIYLAAERTFLAWVRTSLALIGFGFLIARFALLTGETAGLANLPGTHPRPTIAPWLGFFMVGFGVAVCLLALVRHHAYIRALEAGVTNPPSDVRGPLIVAAVLAVAGLIMAVHILTL